MSLIISLHSCIILSLKNFNYHCVICNAIECTGLSLLQSNFCTLHVLFGSRNCFLLYSNSFLHLHSKCFRIISNITTVFIYCASFLQICVNKIGQFLRNGLLTCQLCIQFSNLNIQIYELSICLSQSCACSIVSFLGFINSSYFTCKYFVVLSSKVGLNTGVSSIEFSLQSLQIFISTDGSFLLSNIVKSILICLSSTTLSLVNINRSITIIFTESSLRYCIKCSLIQCLTKCCLSSSCQLSRCDIRIIDYNFGCSMTYTIIPLSFRIPISFINRCWLTILIQCAYQVINIEHFIISYLSECFSHGNVSIHSRVYLSVSFTNFACCISHSLHQSCSLSSSIKGICCIFSIILNLLLRISPI